MTEREKQIGRRNFVKAAATLPVAGTLVWKAASLRPLRVGIIGPGGQGRVLMENCNPNFVKLVAVSDIYPPNLNKGLEIARRLHDPAAQGYSDHRKMLERKDLEAVLVAVPLWMHAPITIDALQAGKHVFVEKTMAYTIEECRRMIEVARTARRQLQVGHQRAYNPLYHEARQLIQNGTIGEVHHVRALWHRNGDWRRKPADPNFDPRPWGYPDIDRLTNWRLYSKFSRGLLSELCSHQIHAISWLLDSAPRAVMGTGGIHRYPDGREVKDHVYAIFDYPKNVTVSYSSIQSNAYDHYYEQFMGTKGTIVLGGESDALLFTEGDRGKPSELAVTPDTGGPVMQASESRARDAAGSSVGGQASGTSALNAYRLELEGFARSIRSGEPNLCDGEVGLQSATAIVKADEAINEGRRLEIGRDLYTMA